MVVAMMAMVAMMTNMVVTRMMIGMTGTGEDEEDSIAHDEIGLGLTHLLNE